MEADIKGRLGLELKFKQKAKGRYPLEEKRLFDEITARRKKGRKVSGWWISKRMKKLVLEAAPTSEAKFGNNWLYRFVRRWGLSWRKTTKRKQQVVESRLARIQRFHQGLRKLLRDAEGKRGGRDLHPKWGNTGLIGTKFHGRLLEGFPIPGI